MKNIAIFFKSNSLWRQVLGTIIASGILWLIVFLFGLFKGLNYYASIRWTWVFLNYKISLLWFLIFIVAIFIINRRINMSLLREIKNLYCSKDEFKEKMAKKLDLSTFEMFEDVYNYRRLENHPWHEQYINDDLKTFKYMLWQGKYKSELYKVHNAIRGLIAEIKKQGFIGNSDKTEIVNELKDCHEGYYNHNKEELVNLLDSIEVI